MAERTLIFCSVNVFFIVLFLLFQQFFFINYLNAGLNEMHVSRKEAKPAFVLSTLFSSFFPKPDNTLKIELAISIYLQPKNIS